MRVIVISDTHARDIGQLSHELLTALEHADLTVHAGDFVEKNVLEGLRAIGEVRAVHGNMDSEELKTVLPAQDELVLNGRRTGLTHGSGAPTGIADRVKRMFEGKTMDIILFGHSHTPCNRMLGDTLMLNPGRASNSYAVLTIDKTVQVEIVRI